MTTTKNVVEIPVTCEHGVTSKVKLKLPLTVKAVDCSDVEDEPLLAVWLMSKNEQGKEWYVTTVSEPTDCEPHANILVRAFRALLATPNGQTAAINFIKHSLAGHSDAA
jgi:hypothetical protein